MKRKMNGTREEEKLIKNKRSRRKAKRKRRGRKRNSKRTGCVLISPGIYVGAEGKGSALRGRGRRCESGLRGITILRRLAATVGSWRVLV